MPDHAEAIKARPNSPLVLLQNRNFRWLWLASLVSNFGGLVQAVGAAWLMTSLAQSQAMVALVQSSVALPIMLFSLPAGVLADSFNRRRIMLTAQILMMAVSVLLATLAIAGALGPWSLLTFTFLIGCGTALHNPSWQSSMGDIVSRENLPSAVALNSMGFNLMRSVGPAAGGAIVAFAGAAAAFVVNAVSYVAIIAALWRWKAPPRDMHLPREPWGSAFSAGLRYVAMSPNLMRVNLRGFLFGFAAISVLALLPLIVRERIEGSALTYGIMLGCFGFGAVGGAMSNAHLRMNYNNEVITRAAFAIFAVGCVLLGLSRYSVITGVTLLFTGASWVVALSLFNVTVQLSTPRWVLGRALALYQTCTFGGMALGSWLWGHIAEVAGTTSVAMFVAAATLLVGMLIGYRFALPDFANVNLDPLNQFREPAVRLDLRQRSGPIMVMVDYEIAQEDVSEFLAAMADRRRIRIRDGAKKWALLRDLEKPDVWTETYHVPTWLEYIRHNERRTQADLAISDRIRLLHRGATPPVVHRMIERQTIKIIDDMPLKPQATDDLH